METQEKPPQLLHRLATSADILDSQRGVDAGLRIRPNADDATAMFPKFQKPLPLGYFSLTQNRDFEPNAHKLNYYKAPPPRKFPLNLNEGFGQRISKPESFYDEGIYHLLAYIHDNQQQFVQFEDDDIELNGRALKAEIVCLRGLLRLIMCTPYENRQNWCIHVTRFKGSLYLVKKETPQDKHNRANESQDMKRFCSYGFKFEQFCLSDSPYKEPDTSAPVDECSEFNCVFSTSIQGISLLYAAEMDGIISENPINLDDNKQLLKNLHFIELKVRQGELNYRQAMSYKRFKTRNWWCQAFLVGIVDVYVGMRNDKGLVNRIEHVDVRSLPKDCDNTWNPVVCATFLVKFLTWLRCIMSEVNSPHTVYQVYFHAAEARLSYQIISGISEHSFLPDWYINLLHRCSSTRNLG